MNRRKPRRDVAVVPRAEGEDHAAAVLRKSALAALAALDAQWQGDGGAARLSFIAGYLAGFARHQALKHGLDAEEDGLLSLMAQLVPMAPPVLRSPLTALAFLPRTGGASPRAMLRASEGLADGGYLAGHLESLCGTRRLLPAAVESATYLTACDTAADRLQTHHPTASLRFDAAERAIVAAAVAALTPP